MLDTTLPTQHHQSLHTVIYVYMMYVYMYAYITVCIIYCDVCIYDVCIYHHMYYILWCMYIWKLLFPAILNSVISITLLVLISQFLVPVICATLAMVAHTYNLSTEETEAEPLRKLGCVTEFCINERRKDLLCWKEALLSPKHLWLFWELLIIVGKRSLSFIQ